MLGNSIRFLLCFAISVCIGATEAWSCATGAPQAINLFAAYETGTVGATTLNNQMDVHSCSPLDTSKYLMVTMGPDIIGLDYSRQISFTDDFRDDQCFLKSSPLLNNRTYQQELIDYREQRTVLEKCVVIEFKDLSVNGISIPDQPVVNGKPLCRLTQLDSNTAIGWGGACFLGLHQDTNLSVQYRVNPECADARFLAAQSLKPQDVHGAFGLYLAGDASGLSTDFDALHSGNFRMTVAPSSALLKLSTDFGNMLPRWPIQFAPDIHLGELTVFDQGPASGILLSWLGDNSCREICKDGLCSSPCSYLTPIAAEVSLKEITNQSSNFISAWYQGGAIPSKWQGMVRDTLYRIDYNPFTVGGRFQISAKFSYPDTYFRLAGENLRRKLISSINLNNSVIGRDPLSPLLPLNQLRTILPSIPTLDILPNLELPNLGSRTFDTKKSLDTLTSYLSLENWPPYFEELCNPELKNCLSPYSASGKIELEIDFTVKHLNPDRSYQLSDLRIRRKTSFGGDYDRPIETLPFIECRK